MWSKGLLAVANNSHASTVATAVLSRLLRQQQHDRFQHSIHQHVSHRTQLLVGALTIYLAAVQQQ
jgi:hypothetical protein